MKLRIILALIICCSLIPAAQANRFTNLFSQENDPYKLRLGGIIIAGVAGVSAACYAIQKNLNSPTRIANKYRTALQNYQAYKNKDVVKQYEAFNKTVAISYHTLTKDIARLKGQEEALGVTELKKQLLELQRFVYNMDTYFLEKKLNSRVTSLQRSYHTLISLDNKKKPEELKREILGTDGSLYPLTNFEQTIITHLYDLDALLFKVTERSRNTILLNQAEILYQQLHDLLSCVRALPEFRAEQKERERARKEEERERRRLQVEEEKLRLERLRLAAELAKNQNPQVVVVNNVTMPPTNNEPNPYIDSPEGYYMPPRR